MSSTERQYSLRRKMTKARAASALKRKKTPVKYKRKVDDIELRQPPANAIIYGSLPPLK
jgi:hypothetical protein